MALRQGFQALFILLFLGVYSIIAIFVFWQALRNLIAEARQARRDRVQLQSEPPIEAKQSAAGMQVGLLPNTRARVTR